MNYSIRDTYILKTGSKFSIEWTEYQSVHFCPKLRVLYSQRSSLEYTISSYKIRITRITLRFAPLCEIRDRYSGIYDVIKNQILKFFSNCSPHIDGLHSEQSLLNNSVSKGSQIYEANLDLKPICGHSGRRALIAHNRLTHWFFMRFSKL